MSQYFPKPYEPFGGQIIVKVYLSRLATKTELKNATEVDTSKFAAKSDLTSSKVKVDQKDVHELKTVPLHLSKLSHVLNKDIVKKSYIWWICCKSKCYRY